MNNLELYDKVRAVPEEAQKTIGAGRLKGFTDINPMWRIKTLTEQFGVSGIGWKTEIVSKEAHNASGGEIVVAVDINLYIKVNGEWSDAIPGTGGSLLVANETKGLHTSDECFKMAYTDAISVACKALGFGADVYWNKDSTKYNKFIPSELDMITKDEVQKLFMTKFKADNVGVYTKLNMTKEQVSNIFKEAKDNDLLDLKIMLGEL